MQKARFLGLAVTLIVLAGCSLIRNDRQFVWDSEYQKVRDLYDRCGSVNVVKSVLADYKWTHGQINEVMYRLRQDYWLDEDGVPQGIDRPRPVAVEAGTIGAIGLGSSTGRDRDYEDRRWERGY